MQIQTVTPEAFWQRERPHDTLVATGNDTVKVVGGVVNGASANAGYVSPARWLGIFHKHAGAWQYATAKGPAFISISDQPSVDPIDVPLTLEPTMPDAK